MAKTYKRKVIKSHHWASAQQRVDESPIYKFSHRKKDAIVRHFLKIKSVF